MSYGPGLENLREENPGAEPVLLALGSNLDDRMGYLRFAMGELERAGMEILSTSSVYESPPLGGLPQMNFLNAAVLARAPSSPTELLELALAIEAAAGRTRPERHAPRTLDIDLIFYGGRVLREAGLVVPHPRWKERSFVVRPAAEIAPSFRDPETGLEVWEVAAKWPQEPLRLSRVADPAALGFSADVGAGGRGCGRQPARPRRRGLR